MIIHSYHGREIKDMSVKGELKYGIEIEYAFTKSKEVIEKIRSITEMTYWCAERDASVDIEFTSHIISDSVLYDALLEINNSIINRFKNKIKMEDSSIHIHIECEEKETKKKIQKFVAENKEFFYKIGQKNLNQVLRFSAYSTGDSKYNAVNISKPKTVEFRFFRNTLDIKDIIMYVKLCKLIYEFIKTTDSPSNINLDNFIKLVKKNSPELYIWSEERQAAIINKKLKLETIDLISEQLRKMGEKLFIQIDKDDRCSDINVYHNKDFNIYTVTIPKRFRLTQNNALKIVENIKKGGF
ncbi:MAG: hypothetical protein QXX30_00940 [Candidatus Aenigmatarchaeota archaeon]